MEMEVQDLGPEEFLGIKDATDLVGGAEAHGSSPSAAAPDGRSPGHNDGYEGQGWRWKVGEKRERERVRVCRSSAE